VKKSSPAAMQYLLAKMQRRPERSLWGIIGRSHVFRLLSSLEKITEITALIIIRAQPEFGHSLE
jgi:hypothetical protein